MTPSWACRSIAVAALGTACARSGGAAGFDAVPASRDVRVTSAPRQGESNAGYAYVARRPLAVVALAEARGIDPEVARAAIDHLADALDACATEEGRKGALADGAARLIAQIDADGSVAATGVHVDPGPGAAHNAVLCFVAPARLLAFPRGDGSARSVAIEAMWGRLAPGH